MPTDRMTAGTVISRELRKNWPMLSLPGEEDSDAL